MRSIRPIAIAVVSSCTFQLAVAPSAVAQQTLPADPIATLLDRALRILGGDSAAAAARTVRITYLGTTDRSARFQGRRWDRADPTRRQESMILDLPTGRGALRTEASSTDGSPSMWRHTALADTGFSINLKTGLVLRLGRSAARRSLREMAWRVPHLMVSELIAERRNLRLGPRATIGGRAQTALIYQRPDEPPLTIWFDSTSATPTGFGHLVAAMDGLVSYRTLFSDYGPLGQLGAFPRRLRTTVGERVLSDLAVLDARRSIIGDDRWFAPPPTDAPTFRIQRQASAIDSVAPSIYVARNVGGYNAMAVDLGDCLAVVDAPASYRLGPLPVADPPRDLGAELLGMLAARFGGKPVCYVIPTHHHDDHFGGIGALADAGATVVTSPGNVALARRVLAGRATCGPPATARRRGARPAILVVRGDRLILGSGERRLEIHLLRNDPHVGEMLFGYVPSSRVVLQADIDDYVLSARNFLRVVDERQLHVERIFGAHNSTFSTLSDLEGDEPVN